MCFSASAQSLLSSESAGETSGTHALWGKAVELTSAGDQRERARGGAGLEPPVRRP